MKCVIRGRSHCLSIHGLYASICSLLSRSLPIPFENVEKTWKLSTKYWQKYMKIHRFNHNIWWKLELHHIENRKKVITTQWYRWIPFSFSLNHPYPSILMITNNLMQKIIYLASKSFSMPLLFLLVLPNSPHMPSIYRIGIWASHLLTMNVGLGFLNFFIISFGKTTFLSFLAFQLDFQYF